MGLHTPQRALKLTAGRHKITLSDSGFSINESFYVEIKPNEVATQVKDYTNQLIEKNTTTINPFKKKMAP